jgi:hypothetical protein
MHAYNNWHARPAARRTSFRAERQADGRQLSRDSARQSFRGSAKQPNEVDNCPHMHLHGLVSDCQRDKTKSAVDQRIDDGWVSLSVGGVLEFIS